LTMVQSMHDLTDTIAESPPMTSPPVEIDRFPAVEIEEPIGIPDHVTKRSPDQTSPAHETPKSNESDVPPKKRSRFDSRRSKSSPKVSKSNSSSSKRKPNSDLSDDQDSDEQDTVKSRVSQTRTRKTPSRRRLLSDSSENETVEEPKKLQSPIGVVPKSEPVAKNDQYLEKQKLNEEPMQVSETKQNKLNSEQIDRRRNKEDSNKNHRNHPSKTKKQRSASRSTQESQKSSEQETSKDVDSRTTKKPRTPEREPSGVSPALASSVVSQLCQLCRELKASLVRGHENFALAVGFLTQLTTIPARLPELAQAWDLMDCIKKCRRYKLSAEVREAAEKALKRFQSIRSTATKEEAPEILISTGSLSGTPHLRYENTLILEISKIVHCHPTV
uniref:LEDGF domain-containing protein n=1 Tax=Echinostoma caproni TaxID=27848 RepID=A0A183B4N2_9TREM